MPAKKTTPPPKVKTVLLIPLSQARERIYRQLDKGNELLKVEIRNEEELRQAKGKYRSWNDYTEELLKQIFNTDEVARQFSGVFGFAVLGGGPVSLYQEIESLRDDIHRDLERLASIYEKLELYPVSSSGILPSEEPNIPDQPYKGSASVTIHNYGTINNPQIQQGSTRSSQTIASSNTSDEIKRLLDQLTEEVKKMSTALSEEQARQISQDLNVLVGEATSKSPRKEWWQLSADGLKKAATDVGEIGKPVLDLVARIIPLLIAVGQMS